MTLEDSEAVLRAEDVLTPSRPVGKGELIDSDFTLAPSLGPSFETSFLEASEVRCRGFASRDTFS